MMQRQFFSTMERLVGVLLGPKWSELDEDTRMKILAVVKDGEKGILNMSSVNNQQNRDSNPLRRRDSN